MNNSVNNKNNVKMAGTAMFGVLGAVGADMLDKAGVLNNKKKNSDGFIVEEDLECPKCDECKDYPFAGVFVGVLEFLWNLLLTLIFFYAIYLSFKCKGKFDIVQFLLACCFSQCYVLYRLAVPCSSPASSNNLPMNRRNNGNRGVNNLN